LRTREVDEAEALALASRQESHFFDRKARMISGRGVQKIAVALTNADGGEFVVGIADDSEEANPANRWQGFIQLEDLNGLLQALFEVSPSLDLRYEILSCPSLQGYVLRVQLEKSSEVHKAADGTVYQRYGAQSLSVRDPQKITELSFAKGASSFEDQILLELPAETIVDSPELASFLRDYSPRTDGLEFCVNQNLLEFKAWTPRVASALLFPPLPSAFVPRKCAVKVTRYETKTADPERDHLAEQITLEGPLYPLIHDTVAAVKRMMKAVRIWTAEGLRTADYPDEAIWEILVNALIHRDYSISDDVQVLVFDNRIEVLSPGRLPGYVTVENILEARFSRNAKIVRTLARYREAPNKDLGEGLNTAFQKMKEFGLKAPIVEEDRGYVRVTLPHTPLAKPTEAILHFLAHQPTITNPQARDLTGIRSENLVKNEFYKLRDEGLLERVPGLAGNKSAWQLTEAGKQKAAQIRLQED
jgi:ATP-dependent DNA helicase RecG